MGTTDSDMSGAFDVTPPELHSAATTLRAVQAELSAGSGDGAGGLGVGDLGSPALAQAVSSLCSQSQRVATVMAAAVTASAQSTDRGAESYVERTTTRSH